MSEAYHRAIKQFVPLSTERERELAEVGTKEARDELVVHNLRFVVSVSAQFIGYGVPQEDLIEEGNLGLIRASECYDGSVRFCSYAIHWIKKRMVAALATQGRAVRVPPLKMVEEDAAPLSLGLDAVRLEATRADAAAEEESDALDIARRLRYLTPRDAETVRLYYGVGSGIPLTSEQIANRQGRRGQAVRACIAKSLGRMRELS